MKWFLITILVFSIPIIITMIHAAALTRRPRILCESPCLRCGGEVVIVGDSHSTAAVCASGCFARIWQQKDGGLEFSEWKPGYGDPPEIVRDIIGGDES